LSHTWAGPWHPDNTAPARQRILTLALETTAAALRAAPSGRSPDRGRPSELNRVGGRDSAWLSLEGRDASHNAVAHVAAHKPLRCPAWHSSRRNAVAHCAEIRHLPSLSNSTPPSRRCPRSRAAAGGDTCPGLSGRSRASGTAWRSAAGCRIDDVAWLPTRGFAGERPSATAPCCCHGCVRLTQRNFAAIDARNRALDRSTATSTAIRDRQAASQLHRIHPLGEEPT
jgi:hypothetical protein